MSTLLADTRAIIVTRGDVDLSAIQASIAAFGWKEIWDNSRALDFGPFGQFIAGSRSPQELVYFQDDDVVTSPAEIVSQWEPGKIVCNVPQTHRPNYEGKPDTLMGFGSCFERSLIRDTFVRYFARFPIDAVTLREPGRIFTAMHQERIKLVDVPKMDLPWATAPNRLYRQACHVRMADEARIRALHCLRREAWEKA